MVKMWKVKHLDGTIREMLPRDSKGVLKLYSDGYREIDVGDGPRSALTVMNALVQREYFRKAGGVEQRHLDALRGLIRSGEVEIANLSLGDALALEDLVTRGVLRLLLPDGRQVYIPGETVEARVEWLNGFGIALPSSEVKP